MLPSRPPCGNHHAFALIPALFFTALLLTCIFGLIVLAQHHGQHAENLKNLHGARSAARAGTLIALGDLQTFTGTDDSATASFNTAAGDGFSATWLGAWHSARIRKEFPDGVALVSNRGIPAGTTFYRFKDFSQTGRSVEVPWAKLGETARIAFFIQDESFHASIKKRERSDYLAPFKSDDASLMRLRQKIPRQTNLGDFFEDEQTDSLEFSEKIARAPEKDIFLFPLLEKLSANERARAQNALTLDACGVPVNGAKKQLKIDLSDRKSFPLIADFVPVEALAGTIDDTFPHNGVLVAKTPALPDKKTGYFSHPFPLLTEIKLHLGFFNPRSDGQHRARFHVTARFWNPYPFPLLAHRDGRLGLFDVENLPFICIKNENTGGEIAFSPSNFPVGRFGLVRQTPSDKTCNAYGQIFDASPQGFGDGGRDAGLHGGEVFLARFPNPQGQPAGLSRNLGGSSWKYQKDPKRVNKPPSGAKKDAWFHPAHTICIESLPGVFPTSFFIRGDAGTLKQQTLPNDYAEPVIVFKNIAFPPFSLKLSGEKYNRAKAGDYDITQASLVWKLRLRAEDADAMTKLFETIDPRLGVFDFSIPEVAQAFEILTLTGAPAAEESKTDDNAGMPAHKRFPLRDRFLNEHATHVPDAFSCVRIFDFPRAPILSAGTFRHFPFSTFAPLATIGEPFLTTRKKSPNAIFDRVYFSGLGKNPHTVPAGKHFLISGAFNINSENADAWAAQFSHNIPQWRELAETPAYRPKIAAPKKYLKYAFFIHPHSAQMPNPTQTTRIFSDKELASATNEERERALLSQRLRETSVNHIKIFSEKIVELLKKRRRGGEKPFRSIEEFVDSGILKTALRESQFNAPAKIEIPAWFPTAISQSVVLESLAPCAFPRGDTFTIFCRAEIFDPFSQKMLSAACAEMRVQRLPEFFDTTQSAETPQEAQNILNTAFGRRYKILSFRYLPNDAF